MSKGRTYKAQLALFAALVVGLFAFAVVPKAAQAADGSLSASNTTNFGGLIFTPQGSGEGTTAVTVNGPDNAGVVTVTQSNPDDTVDFTVTQQTVGIGSTKATAIALDGYTGTLTLNGVTLTGPESSDGKEGNADSAAILMSDGGSDTGTTITPATVVLAGGCKISANEENMAASSSLSVLGGATLLQEDNSTGSYAAIMLGVEDTLILQDGATVTGQGVPAILVENADGTGTLSSGGATEYDETSIIFNGPATVSMSEVGSADEEGAISITEGVGGPVSIEVNANATVSGANGGGPDDSGVGGTAGIYTVGEEVTISGSGTLTLNGGEGSVGTAVVSSSMVSIMDPAGEGAGTPGAAGLCVEGGAITLEGPGTVVAQGGQGADTSPAKTGGTTETAGGPGVCLGAASGGGNGEGTIGLTLLGGTLNALGGAGGSGTTGANGGQGVLLNCATTKDTSAGSNTLNVYGGTLNATGGNQGKTTPAAAAEVAAVEDGSGGGVGIAGGTTSTDGNGCPTLNVQYQPGKGGALSEPVVTCQGGQNQPAENGSASLANAMSGFGTGGKNININQYAGKNATWKWVALTQTAQGTKLSGTPVVQGFAGMLGAPNSAPESTTTPSTTTNGKYTNGTATDDGTTNQLVSSVTSTNNPWVQITTAPITSLDSSIVNTTNNQPVSYVVAQSTVTGAPTAMSGSEPNASYIYAPTVTATFEGLTNANTSKFSALSGLSASTSGNSFEPAANVQTESDGDFYVVPTATGNTLTLSVAKTTGTSSIGSLYPQLTSLEPVSVPVVYTVVLQSQAATVANDTTNFPNSNTTPTPGLTAWAVYTNPNGNGTLVLGNNIGTNPSASGGENASPTNLSQTGSPTWATAQGATALTTLPTTSSSQTFTLPNSGGTDNKTASTQVPFIISNPANPGASMEFIGYFNETGQSYSQVPVTQLGNWSANAVLTPEWASLAIAQVSPTPTQVEQGQSTQITATWTLKPANSNITSYNVANSGLNTGWKAQYENVSGAGSGSANGLSIVPGDSSSQAGEDGTLSVTQTVEITASALADVGSYWVWPTLGNRFTGANVTDGAYGVVNVTQSSAQPGDDTVNVQRVFNPYTQEHLYTTDPEEVRVLVNLYGWDDEGLAWVAPQSSTVGIYRLYNKYNGDHLYTVSQTEYEELQDSGWTGEGVKLYGAPTSSTGQIYRLYNPYMTANGGAYSHLWTGDYNEYVELGNLGWEREGVAWYAIDVPLPTS